MTNSQNAGPASESAGGPVGKSASKPAPGSLGRSSGPAGRAAGVVLGAATLAMGLISGAFYVFACAVMPGLARSGDRVYIEVMQNINDVIQNPVFFASFFGALLCTAAAAWQLRRTTLRWWVFAALLVYAAAFVLTSGANVPLNDDLAAAGDPARIADPAAVRERFEDAWVAWNAVRAALCTVAFGLLARALVLFGRGRDH
ncbi:anthrone oxygenase family protein [Streptomyces luteocolor]|nr:anthrone oxygenase family protein [Streptomyces luteocolor]